MRAMRRVMMIAGEASGDLHGAGVVRELKKRRPDLDVFGVGGDGMQKAGMELLVHISGLSFMGFLEVVRHLGVIREVEKKLDDALVRRTPDVLVLIDYPGFNLRFARRAKRRGIRTLYYISPQVWAWRRGRVKKMKAFIDRMKVVFPFEVDLYREEGIDVEFVGHPLAESLSVSLTRQQFFAAHGIDPEKRLLGLFPGSRVQEVERVLPVMAESAAILQRKHDLEVAAGIAPNLRRDALTRHLPGPLRIHLVENATHELMRHADAAIVTSGTATLEAGWFGTPMIVVYRTSPLSFLIGRLLVDVSNIGLVNIVAGKTVVPEYLQHDMTPANLVAAVEKILRDGAYREEMKRHLSEIRLKLGGPGASARVAEGIVALGEAA